MDTSTTPKPNKRNDQIVQLFRSAFPGHADKAVGEMKRNVRITKDVVIQSKTLVYVTGSAEKPVQVQVTIPTSSIESTSYFVPADSFRVLGK